MQTGPEYHMGWHEEPRSEQWGGRQFGGPSDGWRNNLNNKPMGNPQRFEGGGGNGGPVRHNPRNQPPRN